MPKAGGTSSRNIVRSWFEPNFHTHYINEMDGSLPAPVDLAQVHCPSQPAVIFGHFNRRRGAGIPDYYPEVRQFVTILRDPLALAISRYFYTRKNGKDWKQSPETLDLTINDYLRECRIDMLQHFPTDTSIDNYEEVIHEHFVHIGITEKLSCSMAVIARKLGKRPPRYVPVKNRCSREGTICEQAQKAFRERHELEFAVYDCAKRLHLAEASTLRCSLIQRLLGRSMR
ncbi:hypothetical protein HNR46_002892 [Haloferula luteola]|uniref:Sulfotransferase family protein n=1 Tax=Haloferula luteola TaxID=595692 RepID=A0A840VAR7_9BACT|nr:hypothetical protein [Haloferula luteola]MBB5352644.1 hypothetical protein [Haloferula luteola]